MSFGEMAVFAPDAVARGETPSYTASSVVTLPMFVSRCVTLFVPRTTVGDKQLRVHFGEQGIGAERRVMYSLEQPAVLTIREVWNHLSSLDDERTTIPVSTFAIAATRCNFVYTAKDIECVAAYIGIPDDMTFSDFVVLRACLDMEVSLGDEGPTLGSVAVDCSSQTMSMHTLSELCASEFSKHTDGNTQNLGLDQLCAIVFGPTLRPWLAPRQTLVSHERAETGLMITDWEQKASEWEKVVDKWQDDNTKTIQEFIGGSVKATGTPICEEHLFIVSMQLLFVSAFPSKDLISRAHTAQAYFEVVAGSVDRLANPHELLDLMYGRGTLLDDERKVALTMLGAAASGLDVDLDEAMQELDHHTLRTSRFDLAAVALDKVQRIKSQRAASEEASAQVDFRTWFQFAIDNKIPLLVAKKHLQLSTVQENVQQIRQMRLQQNQQMNDKLGTSWSTGFFLRLLGLHFGRIVWNKSTGSCPERACETFFWGIFGFLLTSAGPLYWACISWKVNGTLPLYFAVCPLMLILPACHFFAVGGTKQTEVASRARLSCITVPRGDLEAASPQNMSVQEVYDTLVEGGSRTKEPACGEFLIIIAKITALAVFIEGVPLFGFYLVVIELPDTWPSYIENNPGGSTAITLWCAGAQFVFIVFAFVFGQKFQANATKTLAEVDRTVTCNPPIIDLKHPENVIAWCRLRDHAARSILHGTGPNQDDRVSFGTIADVAAISVAWATMAAVASVVLMFEKASLTPLRTCCGWFGFAGGLIALVQMASLASADGAVARQAQMLEDQLERISQQAVMAEKNQTTDISGLGVDTMLRSAASVIRAELATYRQTPERRFYYLFGFPVMSVLKSVGTLVVAQGATYGWNSLVRTSPFFGHKTHNVVQYNNTVLANDVLNAALHLCRAIGPPCRMAMGPGPGSARSRATSSWNAKVAEVRRLECVDEK